MNPDALRTLKVDPETMKTLARRSAVPLGPPVSITKDNETPPRAWAGLICLIVAFGTGAFCGRPERHVPPLPAPVRARIAPVVLKPIELEAPRSEPPRVLQKLTRKRTRVELIDQWKKPLFERKN